MKLKFLLYALVFVVLGYSLNDENIPPILAYVTGIWFTFWIVALHKADTRQENINDEE